MTKEELIEKITALGLAEAFLETFTTEELREGYFSFDGPYKFLLGLDIARKSNKK
jgi:hypothetical protein